MISENILYILLSNRTIYQIFKNTGSNLVVVHYIYIKLCICRNVRMPVCDQTTFSLSVKCIDLWANFWPFIYLSFSLPKYVKLCIWDNSLKQNLINKLQWRVMYTHNKRLLKISNFNCAQTEQYLTRNNSKTTTKT